MRNPEEFDPAGPADADPEDADLGTVLTSPADVESAGRSCMAILVLLALIVLLVGVWIVVRSTGGGR